MSNFPPTPPPYQPYEFLRTPPLPIKGPREYSIFGAMIRAPFFNANVSRDVARNWNGICFWYLFLLLLITWIIAVIKIHFLLVAFSGRDVPTLVKEIPPITIKEGHVTSPVEQPYLIKDPKGNKTLVVLDTTGQIKSMDDTDAIMLITDHKIWSRQNNQVKEFDLSKVKYFYVDKAKITAWIDTATHWVSFGLLPVALAISLCLRLIQALIYGSVILGFSNGFRANLNFPAALRLAIVSVTPVILIDTILWAGVWHIPYWWFLGIGVSLLYMIMAVKANSIENLPMIELGNYPTS